MNICIDIEKSFSDGKLLRNFLIKDSMNTFGNRAGLCWNPTFLAREEPALQRVGESVRLTSMPSTKVVNKLLERS